MYTPINPSFIGYVVFKGVKTIQACFRDEREKSALQYCTRPRTIDTTCVAGFSFFFFFFFFFSSFLFLLATFCHSLNLR